MKVTTSLSISDEVWKRVKILAVEQGVTVSSLVERALVALASRSSGKGIFVEEGAPRYAYELSVIYTRNKSQLIENLIEAYLQMGVGDKDLLQRYLRGVRDGWKHPARTGKESEAVQYLLGLAKELKFDIV